MMRQMIEKIKKKLIIKVVSSENKQNNIKYDN
jgi:hypothetical protein